MNLSGIQVLDLTRLLPGPYATQLFADSGADIIKIEEPELGDYARYMEPQVDGTGALFSAVNRGKRSMTLNLSKPSGRKIFFQLAENVDVVMEGFSAGKVDEMGIGYSQVKEVNEEIIYCSLSGYGQTGPYSNEPGHDLNYCGYSGLLDMTRHDTETKPSIPGFPIADMAGGLMAAYRITGALLGRALGNENEQYIDVSLAEAALSFSQTVTSVALAGESPRSGETILTGKFPCYSIYKTADDEYVSLAALEPEFWDNFCEIIERHDLKGSQLSEDPGERENLRIQLQEIFKQRPREKWLEKFTDEKAMVGSVHKPSDVVQDEHFLDRGVFREDEYRVSLQNDYPDESMEWPEKGEHTEEILKEGGFTSKDIQEFKESNVI